MKVFSIVACLLILLVNSTKYTNYQAFQCFVEKGLPQCSDSFSECNKNEECSAQLQKFNQCSFDDSESEKQHIFNGYCFRRWLQNSVQTRNVISCISDKCNLLYNSDIGIGQLYQCMQLILLQKQLNCGQQCENEMGQKVGSKFYEYPITTLYDQTFENAEAQAIVKLVNEVCINENGKGKQMIYQQEKIKEEYRPTHKKNEQKEEL